MTHPLAATGSNNPNKQVSVTRWNQALTGVAITPFMSPFNAVGDNVTDDRAALQAFNDYIFERDEPLPVFADWSGKFAISGQLFIGPSTDPNSITTDKFNVGGNLKLKQLTPTFESVRIRNLLKQNWVGGIGVNGTSSDADFADRDCGVGIAFENCGNSRFQWIITNYFWYAGIHTPTPNNDQLFIGRINAQSVGSGHNAGSLSANFTGASNSGSASNGLQTTTLTGVTAFPDADIRTYNDIPDQVVLVRISGEFYLVRDYDEDAGEVTIFPWLDPDVGTSGSFDWAFGGALVTDTNDGNIIHTDHINAQNCGIGLQVASLYGARLNSTNFTGCGIAVTLGRNLFAATHGTSVDAFYTEGNRLDVLAVRRPTDLDNTAHFSSAVIPDMSKYKALAPRDGSGNLVGGEFGGPNTDTITVSYYGRLLHVEGSNNTSSTGVTSSFTDHLRPSRIRTIFRDSHTVNLSVGGTTVNNNGNAADLSDLGEYHRLFGYKGSTWRYVGTGTNNAPTGTITFNPPTLGLLTCITTNGSATVTMPSTDGLITGMPITGTGIPASTTLTVTDFQTITLSANATASGTVTLTVTGRLNGAFVAVAYSGFFGPVDFAINHKDTKQLDWSVAPVSGWRLRFTKTYDPPSVAASGTTTTTVTSTGAALGDRWVAAFNKDLQGMMLNAYVSAADTVTAVLFNPTAGAIDLASGTLTVSKVA